MIARLVEFSYRDFEPFYTMANSAFLSDIFCSYRRVPIHLPLKLEHQDNLSIYPLRELELWLDIY